MKPEEREQLMASLIYGEITDEERRRLETWFAGHPEDQAEYEELRKTSRVLDCLQPLPDHLVPPLSATHLVQAAGSRKRWLFASSLAAACLAMMFFCVSQGMVIQVGSARVAFGSIPDKRTDNAEVRDLVRQELAAAYLPVVEGVVHTLEDLQTATQLTASRQAALEDSLRQLVTIQTAAQRINERRMNRVASELVNGIDERLRAVYPVVQTAVNNQ